MAESEVISTGNGVHTLENPIDHIIEGNPAKEVQANKLPKFYGFKVSHRNDLEKFQNALILYGFSSRIRDNAEPLSFRCAEILSYFIVMGYSYDTKKFICENLGIEMSNVIQHTSVLTRSGYLLKDDINRSIRYLHPRLIEFRDYIQNQDNPQILFSLIEKA